MKSVLFLDIPTILKTKSKQAFPIHREDWTIDVIIKTIIKNHITLNHDIVLIGNYPNVTIRKNDNNPIESLFINIAQSLEQEFKLVPNSINFGYTTDSESFDFLPLPGLLYTLAADHEILLGYSFVVTNIILGKFIQQYSSVKPIII